MADLTTQQQHALEQGEAVPLVLGQMPCVVIRKDVFERMQRVAYDDSPWTDAEMVLLAARTFDEADRAGPIE